MVLIVRFNLYGLTLEGSRIHLLSCRIGSALPSIFTRVIFFLSIVTLRTYHMNVGGMR